MTNTLKKLLFAMLGSLRDLLPNIGQILMGVLFVVLGLTFFIHGLEQGLFPIGESMATAFARKGSILWLITFAFALGFGTTPEARSRYKELVFDGLCELIED